MMTSSLFITQAPDPPWLIPMLKPAGLTGNREQDISKKFDAEESAILLNGRSMFPK